MLLLRQEVASRCFATACWAKQDDVVTLLFLQSRWHVGLSIVVHELFQLRFVLPLGVVGSCLLLGYLFGSHRWDLWCDHVFEIFRLRKTCSFVLFKVVPSFFELGKFSKFVILFFDLLLDRILLLLALILLSDAGPEFTARLAKR